MKTLIIGSSTRTIKAQDTLRRHGINARIKRLDSARDGCVRGLWIEDGQTERAIGILAENGIPVKESTGNG